MILSVSRRTDIPAFYPKWFVDRVREGFVFVRNPFNANQISRISLGEDVVDCIVFWSKNPEPIIEYLPEISEKYHGAFYFQYTINAYGHDMEPAIPELYKRIDTFKLKLKAKDGIRKRGSCWMDVIIDAAVEYIKVLFAGNSDGHGFDHSMRVYRNAMMIAEAEPAADRTVVALAALLHDADDHKLFQTENNLNARRFLEAEGIDAETADRIVEAINSVSFSRNGDRRPETIEGQIVQDADRLDAIGAIGIARTFAFGGKHDRSLESSIGHFHEKLLLLKDRMNTHRAKELAEDRHVFMETFLKEWQRETEGTGAE